MYQGLLNDMGSLVSIIIPCYKHAQYLPRVLESVLAQTYPRVEIIVVDDGSPDDTASVAERYADQGVKLIRQANAGLSAARNAGIAASGGEWLLFLDADDWIDPHAISELIAVTERRDVLRVAAWHIVYEGVRQPIIDPASRLPRSPDELLHGCRFPCHAVLVPREAIQKSGLFHAKLRSCEDWDLWVRCARSGYAFVPASKAVVFYDRRSGTMSTDALAMTGNGLRVIRMNAGNSADVRIRRSAEQAWIRHCEHEYVVPRLRSIRKGFGRLSAIAYALGIVTRRPRFFWPLLLRAVRALRLMFVRNQTETPDMELRGFGNTK